MTEYNVYRTVLISEYLGTINTNDNFHKVKQRMEKEFEDELNSEVLCGKCLQNGVFSEPPRIYLEQIGKRENEKNKNSNEEREGNLRAQRYGRRA